MFHRPPPSHGFARWSVPEPEGSMFAPGCSAPLPDCHRLCGGCNGDPQCWLQRLAGCLLHGGVVLLLRHVGRHLLPRCHAPLQLPARFLGEPHGHVRRLFHPHVSHLLGHKVPNLFSLVLLTSKKQLSVSKYSVWLCAPQLRKTNLLPPSMSH